MTDPPTVCRSCGQPLIESELATGYHAVCEPMPDPAGHRDHGKDDR